MYRQGDILLIPIPFTDLSSSKKRPVLVVSNNQYNGKTDDMVIVAITSNITTRDYTVMLSTNDLSEGSLKVDSCIRVDKIYTLSQNIVINRFGSVKDYVLDNVRNRLYELV